MDKEIILKRRYRRLNNSIGERKDFLEIFDRLRIKTRPFALL